MTPVYRAVYNVAGRHVAKMAAYDINNFIWR